MQEFWENSWKTKLNKLQATLEVWNCPHLLTGVKCRATSVAKKEKNGRDFWSEELESVRKNMKSGSEKRLAGIMRCLVAKVDDM